MLAALSVIMQILPPLFVTPWFMRIDLVAISWVLCWILFGFKASLLCLLISVPLVGVLGPFAGGWVGAIMKSVSSVWMFAIPAFFAWKTGGTNRLLENKWSYAFSGVLAIVVRDVVCIFFNLYFALPVFFGMTIDDIVSMFSTPGFLSFVGHSLGLVGLGAYVIEVAFWNTIQGIMDIYVSLIIGAIILRTITITDHEDASRRLRALGGGTSILGLLAAIIGVGGVAILLIGLLTSDILLIVFGGFNLLQAYAWSLVDDMRKELDELKRKSQ